MIRYFAHGECEDEDGVSKVPDFDERYMAVARALAALRGSRSPNHLKRYTARTNLNIALVAQSRPRDQRRLHLAGPPAERER